MVKDFVLLVERVVRSNPNHVKLLGSVSPRSFLYARTCRLSESRREHIPLVKPHQGFSQDH